MKSPEIQVVMQEIIDREGWAPAQVFSESGSEDYLALEQKVPIVYALLPGQVVLPLKDLTDVLR